MADSQVTEILAYAITEHGSAATQITDLFAYVIVEGNIVIVPRAAITVQRIVRTAIEPTYEAADVDGNSFINGQRCFVEVVNGDASPITVTFNTPGTIDDTLAIDERTVTVPAGERRFVGPWVYLYEQTDGTVYIDYSAVANITVAVFSLV